jgi:hypothetical protein
MTYPCSGTPIHESSPIATLRRPHETSRKQRPVIHRELRIIRRISREHLQDRAQDYAIDDNYHLRDTMNTLSSKLTAFAAALAMNGLIVGSFSVGRAVRVSIPSPDTGDSET